MDNPFPPPTGYGSYLAGWEDAVAHVLAPEQRGKLLKLLGKDPKSERIIQVRRWHDQRGEGLWLCTCSGPKVEIPAGKDATLCDRCVRWIKRPAWMTR